MAKAKRHFFGLDTFGRGVEKAQRVDGVWFSRFQCEARNWTRWEECEAPRFETHGKNAYSGESFEHSKPVAMWGFNPMREIEGEHRIRLPN